MSRERLLVYFALTLASALVVVLGTKVRILEEHVRTTRDRLNMAVAGDFVPTFETLSLAGSRRTIGESGSGGRQLLFVFTTTCPYCEASLPAWQELAAVADTFSSFPIAVIGITLDSADVTGPYVRQHGLAMDIVAFPARKLTRLYKVRSVPQTLVIDGGGQGSIRSNRCHQYDGSPGLHPRSHDRTFVRLAQRGAVTFPGRWP